jgi:uncharacterized protein (DUF2141 family)
MKNILKSSILFIVLICISVSITQCNTKSETTGSEIAEVIDADSLVADTIVVEEDVAMNTEEVTDTLAAAKPKTIATQKPLTLIIGNLKSTSAPVIVSVYGTTSKFPAPHGQLKEYKFKPHGNVLTAKITNLKFGTYAIATYQDENSSGEIDKNFIGMPTEGYAFSKNFKPTVKAPNFDQCRFDYNKTANTLTINMIQ